MLEWLLSKIQKLASISEDVEKREPLCNGGKVISVATMENSMSVPQKLQIKLPYDPATPLLGICPKKMKTLTRKDICIPVFTAALFTIAKIWKQPKSNKEGMDKEDIHTMEYYSAIKKNKILPFVSTQMDLEGVMLNKINQTEKDKYCMILLTRGILRTKQNSS